MRLGCAVLNPLNMFPEPPFTERGPTPKIEVTCFPGRNLGPPRHVLPLIALACSGVSKVQFMKREFTNQSVSRTPQQGKTTRPRGAYGTIKLFPSQ